MVTKTRKAASTTPVKSTVKKLKPKPGTLEALKVADAIAKKNNYRYG